MDIFKKAKEVELLSAELRALEDVGQWIKDRRILGIEIKVDNSFYSRYVDSKDVISGLEGLMQQRVIDIKAKLEELLR